MTNPLLPERRSPADTLVGVLLEPSADVLVALLGILRSGAAFVPLDHKVPRERLAVLLEECALETVVTTSRHLGRVLDLAGTGRLRHVVCIDGGGDGAPREAEETNGVEVHYPDLAGAAPTVPEDGVAPHPDAAAYVVFTSGTSGRPKGVVVSRANLEPMLRWGVEALGLDASVRVLQTLSYTFDFGIFELLTTVVAGGSVFFPGPDEAGDPQLYAGLVPEHGVDTIHGTPAFARELFRHLEAVPGSGESLRRVHLGGEAMDSAVVEGVLSAAGNGCALFNGYGPTEATINSSLYRVDVDDARRGASIPIGRASAANRLYVLDGRLRTVVRGLAGELCVGGPGVARGYLGRPALTAGRFLPDPYAGEPGARLYRTGDRVRLREDGELAYMGRLDEQVKVRGFRIEPAEIEVEISRRPGVAEAAVLAYGEGADRFLTAYVVPTADGFAGISRLRDHLDATLPRYMVPSAFVTLDALPRTSRGKLDRRALPVPEIGGLHRDVGRLPERGAEKRVAMICSELLGLDEIGVEENLFDLGCHSLLATQVVARMREECAADVTLRQVFETPTVGALARLVDSAPAAVAQGEAPVLPALTPQPDHGDVPLSFAQERIWFLHQLDPDGVAYNVPRAVAMRGVLDIALLEQVFREIVRRHEILRTVFLEKDGKPVQVVQPPWPLDVRALDLRDLPLMRSKEEMRAFVKGEGARPFNLASDPLLRLTVLRYKDDEWMLVSNEHHMVHDGWTQGVLAGEFLRLYRAGLAGRPMALPEPKVQYRDFARWQRTYLRGDLLERQIDFWRQELEGAPTVLELSTDRPRPARLSGAGAMETNILPVPLANDLRALGRRHDCTFFMTAGAVYAILLWSYSRQEDMTMGTVVANRGAQRAEDLLGMIVNTMVLRLRPRRELTFQEFLIEVRDVCVAAYDHQDAPFEKVVEAVRPARSLSWNPLFQVIFSFLNTPAPSLDLPGLDMELVPSHNGSAKFDINITAVPRTDGRIGGSMQATDSGVELMMEYSTDLFDPVTISRMAERYQHLLRQVAEDPGRRIGDLDLLTPSERRQILVRWQGARRRRAVDATVVEMVDRRAAETPGALAISATDGRWTYAELSRRASHLAARLAAEGVGPGSRVALVMERSAGLVAGALAVMRTGAAYVPVDPAYPEDRLRYVLDDADARVVLAAGGSLAAAGDRRVLDLAAEETWDGWDATDGTAMDGAPGDGWPAPPLSAIAYVIYTSGSTGWPKGVEIPHRGLANLVAWHGREYHLKGRERATLVASPGFDACVWEMWPYLAAGSSLHVPEEAVRSHPEALAAWMERQGITHSFLPTPLAEAMLAAGLPAPHAGLQVLLTGGDRLHRRPSPDAAFKLVNHYGPTECTVVATRAEVAPSGHGAPSIGSAIGHLQAYVVDPEGRLLPPGLPGELLIGGEGLAQGYLGRPALTAASFVPSPFGEIPGSRLYRSGDLVRWRIGGQLEFQGRRDQQVKVRGFRIELGEIEVALLTVPGVAEAAVVLRDDGGISRLEAWLVAEDGATVTPDEARDHLAQRLPEYMVPQSYGFTDALPLGSHGKVDRAELLRRPAPAWRADDTPSVAPRNPTEELLVEIWKEVLEIDEVGVHDDFFALGGHSLIATRVISRVRRGLGVEPALRTFFETPTVAGLAAVLDRQRAPGGVPSPPVEPRADSGDAPLSFTQERLWFLDRLQPGSALYNLPAALAVDGELAPAALRRALSLVVERHQILRTTFHPAPGDREVEAVQRVAPPGPVALPVVDLSALAGESEPGEHRRLRRAEAQRPFDLVTGPPLRAALVRRAGRSTLLVTLHHIVADGWSVSVLARELAEAYRAALHQRPARLPDLPVQYADFAVWERRWRGPQALAGHLREWRRVLAGLPPRLELPTDRPRPPVQSHRGARRTLHLSAALHAAAVDLARSHGATPFMVLLAAFQALLGRISGSHDLAVGTPVAHRDRVETEGLVGFFVNTLVLRADLSGDPAFGELVERTRARTLEAFALQDLPFSKLVEELAPERSLATTPLFQVLFVLQNAAPVTFDLGDVELRPEATDPGIAKFDLTLTLADDGDGGLDGSLEYSTDLFDAATIERLAERYVALLEAAVARPGSRLSELPLLLDGEHRALASWEDGGDAAPGPETLDAWFWRHVTESPEATAVESGGESWSYRRLARRAEALAARLAAAGVGPERRVGILLERSPDLLAAILAVLRAGGAYVPLDPGYPERRIAAMVEDSAASLVVTRGELADLLPAAGAGGPPVLDLASLGETHGTAAGEGGAFEPPPVRPGNLAYLIYTSGSTGRPKGVAIPHSAAAAMVGWAVESWSEDELSRVLAATSVCFDLSVFEIFAPLSAGGTVVLVPDALALADLPAEAGVTLVNTVPSALDELLRAGGLPASVRAVNLAGEALSGDLARRVHATGVGRLSNLYGPSEDTTYSTFRQVPPGETEPAIGRPIAGTRARVLDGGLRPVPVGVAGELCLAGAGVTRGYLGRPARTAAAFVPDPDGDGGRLYRTGDLARWRADGQLHFLGRSDHQVKVRGHRVELGEVEAALVDQPAVAEAAVQLRAGEAGGRMVAFVVAEDAGGGDEAGEAGGDLRDDLRRRLRARLPEVMVPSAFVLLPELPRSANGKLDRVALAEVAVDGDGAGTTGEPPRTATEKRLAGLWADLLPGAADSGSGISIHRQDRFFDRGGHSLLALRLSGRVTEAFGVELPVREIFTATTLEEMARRVDRAAATDAAAPPAPTPELERQAPASRTPLSPAQRRLWLMEGLVPGTAVYNLAGGLTLEGDLDRAALRRALADVVGRHEVLRSRFPAGDDGEPRAELLAPGALRLSQVDLSALPDRRRVAVEGAILTATADRPFDLDHGPLARFLLVRSDRRRHSVFCCLHHSVFDGASMPVLLADWAAAYGARCRGDMPPTGGDGIDGIVFTFADYSHWQERLLQARRPVLASFWRRHLATSDTPLELPTDHPRPERSTLRGEALRFHWDEPLVAALEELGGRRDASLFMVLMAAYQVALAAWSGQSRFVVGMPVAGRRHPAAEGMVGPFVNLLPLASEIPAEGSFEDLLARVRDDLLAVFEHGDMPFDTLVQELRLPPAPIGENPLVRAVLNFTPEAPAMPAFPGLEARRADFGGAAPSAVFDLALLLERRAGEGLEGRARYRSDLLEEATVAAWAGELESLLRTVVERPGHDLRELVQPLADAAVERRQARRRRLRSAGLDRLRRHASTVAHGAGES